MLFAIALLPSVTGAQQQAKWVTSWAASVQGPFPSGSALALPDQSFAFPEPTTGANDQTFRMIVRPSVWGKQARLRFSNVFGTQPLKLDGVFVALQLSSAALVPKTNTPVRFSGRGEVSIAPGKDVWSDPVTLPFSSAKEVTALAGRKLAVSFHVVGSSGPMTWHAKSLQASYVSLPNAGAHGSDDGEQAFPTSSTAWFFLDAVDMQMPGDTPLVVCFGDSITDGTGSTLSGDDRWPDILQRRLASQLPNGVAVVDAGIGGNLITGPESYSAQTPAAGGPAAIQRIDRDVVALSGVTTVIWFEGINDLSHDVSTEKILEGLRIGIASLRKAIPGVRVVGATITPSLGAASAAGSADVDRKRKTINETIRSGGMFDAYVDFDQATVDPQSGGLKTEFVPSSTIGGPGDKLHPNRAGYLSMANAIPLETILPRLQPGQHK